MLLRSSSAPVLHFPISALKEPDFPPASDDLHHIGLDNPARIRDCEIDVGSRPWLARAQSEGDLASLKSGSARACAASSLRRFKTDGSHGSSSWNKQWTKRVSGQCRASAIDWKDSILEESEILEFKVDNGESLECIGGSSQVDTACKAALEQDFESVRSLPSDTTPVSKSGRSMDRFVLDDGQIYTSLKLHANGSTVACNSKGCRPLTEIECAKLGPLYMASGLGIGEGGGYHGGNGWNGCMGRDFNTTTDGYYQRLLQSDPQNPLLLRNYAQYLAEAKGDHKRSEEMYERAILACPGDGEVLSQYAKLVWDVHRDQDRTENYYDQAVQAAPDDCYVLASYASFLWDAEEDDDINPSPPTLNSAIHGAPQASPPLVAFA